MAMAVEHSRGKIRLSHQQAEKLAEGMVRPYTYYQMTPEQRTTQLVENMFEPYDLLMDVVNRVSNVAKKAVQLRSKR